MRFFSLLFITLCAELSAQECSVELFAKIYRLEANQALSIKDIIRNSDCPSDLNGKITTLVSSSQGTLGSDFLTRELQKDFPELSVTFTNRKLSLLELNPTIRSQLLPESNLYFTQSRSLNGLSTVGLIEGESLQVVCDGCQSFGEKNIKLNIVNIANSSTRTIWFASKIMAKLKVIKAKRSISFQQKALSAEDFYMEEILTMSPDNMITSLDNIQYFKANRTLLQGSTVSHMDLQGVNLITFGTPVQVQLKSSTILLQKTAMPVRSAKYGETVELKGSNNKLIAGKVTDYNKVVIEL